MFKNILKGVLAVTKSLATGLADSVGLNAWLSKHLNKETVVDIMTFSALIAYADGKCEESERTKLWTTLSNDTRFKTLVKEEMVWLREQFAHICAQIELIGLEESVCKAETLAEHKYQELPEDVRKGILAILVLICKADGDFSSEEIDVVKRLCMSMMISPKVFGLDKLDK